MDKKKTKVKILASSHPQFDEIIDLPPEGIEYEVDRVKTKYHGWITEKKIDLHNKILKILPIPRMTSTKTNGDIVHSTRGIIQIFQKKPWIIDCECGSVFTSFNWKAMKNPIVRKIIMHALKSKNCKKILPQSNAAKEDLRKKIGNKNFEKIKHKVEVLYLAMRPNKEKKIKRKDKKIILSFVGIHGFYGKGTHDLLKTYEKLTKKYNNLELKMKCDEFPEKYKKYKKLPGLKVFTKYLPKKELFKKLYLESDVFVLPTMKDHYGVVLLEAMSAGLPLIGTNSFTLPELIKDGKNGFLIKTRYSWEMYPDNYTQEKIKEDFEQKHPKIINQLIEKISILIENKKLREKMGKESRKMIEDENGQFSIKKRNRQLKKIYEECLNSSTN